MSTRRLPLLFVFFILLASPVASAQTRGGGSRSSSGGSYVNPATNARNAAVLGTGNDLEAVVHPNSVNDEPKVEFRSQTVLIQVPVVITDKSGNHLHGLSKEDFTLLENGKPVNVAAFE